MLRLADQVGSSSGVCTWKVHMEGGGATMGGYGAQTMHPRRPG